MFDIGFSELILIGVVALIVIGPERLPKVARTAGHLFGRFQRYVSSVKSDISREMQLEELRKAGQSFKESVESAASTVQRQAGEAEAEFTMRDEVGKDKLIDAAGLTEEKAALEQTQAAVEAQARTALDEAQATLDWGQRSEGVHSPPESAKPTDSQEKA